MSRASPVATPSASTPSLDFLRDCAADRHSALANPLARWNREFEFTPLRQRVASVGGFTSKWFGAREHAGLALRKGTGEWQGSVGIANFREVSRLAKMAVDFRYPPVPIASLTLVTGEYDQRCPLRRRNSIVKIELNHTIVPAHDKEQPARFYERIFGFKYEGPLGHFAPVRIENQSLSLDFDDSQSFHPHHHAFKVGETEFDEIFKSGEGGGAAVWQRTFLPR